MLKAGERGKTRHAARLEPIELGCWVQRPGSAD